MSETQPKVLKIAEAAKYLNMNQWTLYRLAAQGKVPGVKIGGQWRFRQDLLDKMFENGGDTGPKG